MGRTALPSRPGNGVAPAQRGFTYFGILIAILLIGIALAVVGTVTRTQTRRQKEVQLLFVGHEFRHALARYAALNGGRYPLTLEELVNDERGVKPVHYLRRVYLDPITGSTDWQFLRLSDGGIYGIYSGSSAVPLKRVGFEGLDRVFEEAPCYRAWRFTYVPRGRRIAFDPPPADCAAPPG